MRLRWIRSLFISAAMLSIPIEQTYKTRLPAWYVRTVPVRIIIWLILLLCQSLNYLLLVTKELS
jgi:hypothetical protein